MPSKHKRDKYLSKLVGLGVNKAGSKLESTLLNYQLWLSSNSLSKASPHLNSGKACLEEGLI